MIYIIKIACNKTFYFHIEIFQTRQNTQQHLIVKITQGLIFNIYTAEANPSAAIFAPSATEGFPPPPRSKSPFLYENDVCMGIMSRELKNTKNFWEDPQTPPKSVYFVTFSFLHMSQLSRFCSCCTSSIEKFFKKLLT